MVLDPSRCSALPLRGLVQRTAYASSWPRNSRRTSVTLFASGDRASTSGSASGSETGNRVGAVSSSWDSATASRDGRPRRPRSAGSRPAAAPAPAELRRAAHAGPPQHQAADPAFRPPRHDHRSTWSFRDDASSTLPTRCSLRWEHSQADRPCSSRSSACNRSFTRTVWPLNRSIRAGASHPGRDRNAAHACVSLVRAQEGRNRYFLRMFSHLMA